MPTLNKIFAVIDPTTDNQIALTRAGKFAGRNEDIAIHAYEAIHVTGDCTDVDAMERVETARHQAWLDTLAPAALRAGASLII